MTSNHRNLPLVLALLLASSCGVFRSDEVRFVRYFRPVPPEPGPPPARAEGSTQGVSLVVRAAGHLEPRIAWRKAGVEYGYHDDLRWIETPERLLHRRLEEELYGRRGARRVTGGRALAVELVAFEHAIDDPRQAIVGVVATLASPGGDETRASFEAARPIAGEDPEELARAMGEALADVVDRIGAWATE